MKITVKRRDRISSDSIYIIDESRPARLSQIRNINATANYDPQSPIIQNSQSQ